MEFLDQNFFLSIFKELSNEIDAPALRIQEHPGKILKIRKLYET